MMNDAINSDIGNQSFDNYINKIYTYYVAIAAMIIMLLIGLFLVYAGL